VELFLLQLPPGFDVQRDVPQIANPGLDEEGESLGRVDAHVRGEARHLDDALELLRVEIVRKMRRHKVVHVLTKDLLAGVDAPEVAYEPHGVLDRGDRYRVGHRQHVLTDFAELG